MTGQDKEASHKPRTEKPEEAISNKKRDNLNPKR